MENHYESGIVLRSKIKDLVLDFLKHQPECKPNASGLKQTVVFRKCGLDWGNKKRATSTNQQYWVIAVLRELEAKGMITQDIQSNQWRLLNEKFPGVRL